ncbi:MAG: tetratricopeptide repeat protein, partial [Chloroflexi bacterium]
SYQRLQGTYTFLSYVVVFALMAGYLRRREQVDRLVSITILTSIPVSLYGIVQHYGLDPLPWAGNVTARVASNMGNAIFVASYLIMVVPLTFSRLLESLTAIIEEEDASWGHTILAAVYIFTLAVQLLTIVFSRSRGPMLGLLVAFFVMGLLLTLLLRRADRGSALSLTDLARGVSFLFVLAALAGLAGGLGYGLGKLLSAVISLDALPLLGAAAGAGVGFGGAYVYLISTRRGWRWLWASWLTLAALSVLFILLLNLRGTSLDTVLDPLRSLPMLDRLSQITITESGTGKVRVLIWDAAIELVKPHRPLGIPGDEVVGVDGLNAIRPIVGYGPESMFNAFAFVYPPDLAYVERRGSSADRSHNETMDSLVITGALGFLAFYYLMVSLFYHAVQWLGLVPTPAARQRFIALLVGGALAGAVAAYLLDTSGPRFTFVPLGLPFGLVAGMVLYLAWEGLVSQPDTPVFVYHPVLVVGVLGAIIGHFIEVHFVFSIAATYTYFWLYAGLLVGLARLSRSEAAEQAATAESLPASETNTGEAAEPAASTPEPRGRKPRARRRGRGQAASPRQTLLPGGPESLDVWVGSQGLAMAVILIILNFDFVTPRFQFSWGDKDSMSLLWMFVITWLVGLGIAVSDVAVRRDTWKETIHWGRLLLVYGITSLGYTFFYSVAHRIQFSQQITLLRPEDAIRGADVFSNGLVLFYIFLFLLMALFALLLAWTRVRGLAFWRADVFNLVLYPVLILAAGGFIWFKNINVVRADLYLKEGDRYRNSQQWTEATLLHRKAISLDSDEDFYYLMLALDYQLMAQDSRLDEAQRRQAWIQGEQTALEARRINPFNPDNTGNMGRYYFTVAQVFDPSRFKDALAYFEKATILAPTNVVYHNLWAQTYYMMQDYQSAIERLKVSIEIDPRYAPTWLLLGDTYAAIADVDQALKAHAQAISLVGGGADGFAAFTDQFLDQRLNFYLSAGRLEDIVAAFQRIAPTRPNDGRVPWVIGHIYNLAGQREKAIIYFEQALTMENSPPQALRELANTYLSLERYEKAQPLYQQILQINPNDIESHSALAYIYARQGRLDEAIRENQTVLQLAPNDYDSLKNLAILYQQQGEWQKALDAARQAREAAPEADRPSWEQFITDLENQLN